MQRLSRVLNYDHNAIKPEITDEDSENGGSTLYAAAILAIFAAYAFYAFYAFTKLVKSTMALATLSPASKSE